MTKQPPHLPSATEPTSSYGPGPAGLAALLPVLVTLAAHVAMNQGQLSGLKGVSPTRATPGQSLPVSTPATELFRQAVNTAMSAAHLTQVARTPEQWHLVASQWEGAIATLRQISPTAPPGSLAQQKVAEYQHNLNYARQNAQRLRRPTVDLRLTRNASRPVSNDGPLRSGTWLRVATLSNQQGIYIDSDTVARNFPYVRFWQRTVSSKGNGQTWIQDQQWVVNCQNYQLQPQGKSLNQPLLVALAKSPTVKSNLLQAICGHPPLSPL